MKKTTCIRLVLITAALAGCDRPLYQQGPDYSGANAPGSGAPGSGAAGSSNSGSYDPYSPSPDDRSAGEGPDSTNSCPLVDSQLPPDYYLWYSGLRPWDFYYGDWFNLDGYYAYRYPATIVRAGFGKIGYGRVGGSGHS
ncbi:MAG TPA: hypothetical protein VKR41_04630 [Puia sp.]|nr:hypothetical protein [Puia sp.]